MAYLFVPFPMTLENLEGHSPNAGLIKCAYTDRQLREPSSRHRRLAANAGSVSATADGRGSTQLNSTQLNIELRTQVSDTSKSAS